MSQSPESLAASLADEKQADRYRRGWKALSELIGQGKSFSGSEKNCCFLNTGDGRFADVSSATGLDFADDGRAVAVCDWDFDGRQDFWVSNRTAPRVRLLRNSGSGGNWIALKLRGTSCNLDAIGARVVVRMRGGEMRSRALHAGDGFLAQSSKWLHLGLGEGEIGKVTVHWPGNSPEEISGVMINAFQTIKQGSGTAKSWSPPAEFALKADLLPEPEVDSSTRTWLIGRIPLPSLPGLPAGDGRPKLIALWSQTCPVCLAELTNWSRHASRIKQAGLSGIVLSVDELLGEQVKSPPEGLPFAHGVATDEIAEALDVFHRTFVERQDPLPVPTGFLLDREGRVAAIYKGPVELERLLADVKLLDGDEHRAREAAVPFPGRWASDLFPPQPKRLAEAFARAGRPEWRDRYLADYAERFSGDGQLPRQATVLLEEGKAREAVALLAKLFENVPGDFPAHRAAGVLLLQHNIFEPARAHLRAALAGFKDDANFRFNLGLAEASNGNAVGALENFQAAARLNPQDPAAHFQLANVLHALKRSKEAIGHYRKALALKEGWALPANNLAWILSTHPNETLRDGAAALALMKSLTIEENSSTLSTVAAALAETGEFAKATETANRALNLARQAGNQREMQTLQAALQLYTASMPLRSP